MKLLQDKIRNEATIIDNRIIKVDHFINHMLDTKLIMDIGKEFSTVFPNATKILTIEASGIAFAVATAFHLGNIPIVFARKSKSLISGKELYHANVFSFTKEVHSEITVSKEFLSKEDKILIIDDFLAKGNALEGMIKICNQANCDIVGAGIVIEKGFENGRKLLDKYHINIHTLANIKSIKNNQIEFINE